MIYLDHNATTPVLPEVVEAMLPWLTSNWGNPSSIHAPGRLAKRAVEAAREQVAHLVGANPEQVIFTSGATESINSAIHSALLQDSSRRHVITSAVEHSAVLAYCEFLESFHGIEVTRLGVTRPGDLETRPGVLDSPPGNCGNRPAIAGFYRAPWGNRASGGRVANRETRESTLIVSCRTSRFVAFRQKNHSLGAGVIER
jgi:hypothetical protein